MPPNESAKPLTLLDLVAAVSAVAESESEVVRIVQRLLGSGYVRLVGNFRGVHLEDRGRPTAAA